MFDIKYNQYSESEKRIVKVSVTADKYKEVESGNNTYTLVFRF